MHVTPDALVAGVAVHEGPWFFFQVLEPRFVDLDGEMETLLSAFSWAHSTACATAQVSTTARAAFPREAAATL